jgi:hypothetical protein
MTWRSGASFVLALASSLTVTVGAFLGASSPTKFAVVLVALIGFQALIQWRLWASREFGLYAAFAAYNAISILWTSDVHDAVPNLQLTLNFCLIMILFGSLVAFHSRRAVVGGIFAGFLLGALTYTRLSGFPLVYPDDFSYNSIAGMYLFGLFVTMVYGWYRGARLVPTAVGLALMLLIAATTSIKTNLGEAIGAGAAGLIYFKQAMRAVGRNLIVIVILVGGMSYFIASNEALTERLQSGTARVGTGANVLAARDAANGDSGYSMRQNWKNLGLKGWATNPVVGYGVESFRGDFGVTSHSTPVDLLYNTGLIGCLLFYAVFASLGWRLLKVDPRTRVPHALILGAIVCYVFISLSGTMYYDGLLAAILAMCAALVCRPESEARTQRYARVRTPDGPGPVPVGSSSGDSAPLAGP